MKEVNSDAIYKFCRDEVERQGYNVKEDIGFSRVVNMLQAWDMAIYRCWIPHPTISDILRLGYLVEPCKNLEHSFRKHEVRVGNYIAPLSSDVSTLMEEFVKNMHEMTPDEAYLRFEHIHPFVDGNGRVGKIIWNWINNTLNEPILVQDFFGGGNP